MSKELEQQKILASAMRRYEALQRDESIDPDYLDSRPTDKQKEVFAGIADCPIRAVIAANQVGKSSLGGREIAWLCENKHPYADVMELWNTESLTILVLGQVGEQIESNLWAKKIKPFLTPGTYKEVRIGSALQRVEFKNGTRIIFISHHNAQEARKTVQGYPAHYVWIDEMPNSLSLIAELITRIISKKGRLLLTFTPLLRNIEIKNVIEGLKPPNGKKYNFHMLDNPIFAGREAAILAQFADYPEAERRARLYGEWYAGDTAVYQINLEKDVVDMPKEYSSHWDHIEAVDPAASGKTGYILLTQSPMQRTWYVTKGKYIDGAAATDLIHSIHQESSGASIVRRVSDPHEVWFIKEASKQGLIYIGVYNKSQRRNELISNCKEMIRSGRLKISRGCKDLIQELISAQWSDTVEDKIVNSTNYHQHDALLYALDNLPHESVQVQQLDPDPVVNHDRALREANQKRKEREHRMKIRNGRKSKWSMKSLRSWH